MTNRTYRVSQVFVPGGMPDHTYIARSERKLENQLAEVRDNLCKLVIVTGTTKSGKTVLTNRIFPRGRGSIWVDGGTIGQEDDFWHFILEQIDGFTTTAIQVSYETGFTASTGGSGEFGIPFVAKGQATGEVGANRSHGRASEKQLSLTPRAAAIAQLREKQLPLVVDDFHYLNRDFQANIVRALKPLIFEGLPVILIAIPHRRYDAIRVEREMTGRLHPIPVPIWRNEELAQIAIRGFPLLNTSIADDIVNRLADEAIGSPHLMQEFCRHLARRHEINETLRDPLQIDRVDEDLFCEVAADTGKAMFDKLAKGPRQRTDRIQRSLKDGKTADIYEVVLLALANLKLGLDTVDYEALRTSIRDILASDIPQAHEVTRVLEKLAEIAASDESSTPVIDWERDEQKLHITDPFFAFYLKWGALTVS